MLIFSGSPYSMLWNVGVRYHGGGFVHGRVGEHPGKRFYEKALLLRPGQFTPFVTTQIPNALQ